MSIYPIIIILLVVAGLWAIWQYVKDPFKTILLVVLGLGLVIYLLKLMNVVTI